MFGSPQRDITAEQAADRFMRHSEKELAEARILEFGAGTGKLALDILQTLQHENALPQQYIILEVLQKCFMEKVVKEALHHRL